METFSALLALCTGPHKGQWRGALIYYFICAWINGWINNHEAGDLRRHRDHYDVILMVQTGMLTHWTTIPVTTTPISVQPRSWTDGMPQKSHSVSSHALGRQHSDFVSYCHGLALGITFGNVSSRLKRVRNHTIADAIIPSNVTFGNACPSYFTHWYMQSMLPMTYLKHGVRIHNVCRALWLISFRQ